MHTVLFGGLFNPVHLGHIALAEASLKEFNLDRVIFIPSNNPPHKLLKNSYNTHRYNMLKIAIKSKKYFEVSKYELNKKYISYTCDTINYFKKKIKEDKIYFLIGSDWLSEIHTWKLGVKLFDLCTFIIGVRHGFDCKILSDDIKNKVLFLKSKIPDISSSFIRQQIKDGKNVNNLVPEGVYEYIIKHKLYRADEIS